MPISNNEAHVNALEGADGADGAGYAGYAWGVRERDPGPQHTLQPELEPFQKFWQSAASAPRDQELDEDEAKAYLQRHGFPDALISTILKKCEEQARAREPAPAQPNPGKRQGMDRRRTRRPSVPSALCELGDVGGGPGGQENFETVWCLGNSRPLSSTSSPMFRNVLKTCSY